MGSLGAVSPFGVPGSQGLPLLGVECAGSWGPEIVDSARR
ncbi:hypothetical protein APASM_6738 [Actinosynnema pretiosum subsp. pretiosum]|nr:hypothetical protein APASM_6738 [Actinosynnema pretiosum subsp. pretiosum]